MHHPSSPCPRLSRSDRSLGPVTLELFTRSSTRRNSPRSERPATCRIRSPHVKSTYRKPTWVPELRTISAPEHCPGSWSHHFEHHASHHPITYPKFFLSILFFFAKIRTFRKRIFIYLIINFITTLRLDLRLNFDSSWTLQCTL